jgi:hypothetical protein
MPDRQSVGAALVFILIGLFFLLNNVGIFDGLDWSVGQIWPGVILLAGLFFLYQFLFGAVRDPGLVFVGTAATLLGLHFFLYTLNVELPFEFENLRGPIDWDDSAYLWPAYPLIGGIAFILMSLSSRDRNEFGVGLAALAVALIAFPFTLGNAGQLEDLVKLWPVVLILAGGWMLLKQVLRVKK